MRYLARVAFAVLLGCSTTQSHRTPAAAARVEAAQPAPSVPSSAGPSAGSEKPKEPAPPPELKATSVALPGAQGPVTLDLIAYDREHGRVWVPVGDTGSVDVFEIHDAAFKRVDGFKIEQREVHGHTRAMGPSSIAIGDGVAYVGTRSTNEVCAVDEKSLQLGKCLKLSSAPDFVSYLPSAKEVWVTTPKEQSLTVLDASKPALLKSKLVIKAPGSVEGCAFDADHGVFYTNLEDKNQTLVVDLKSHAIKTTWSAGCDGEPHGVAVDPSRNFVFVACADKVRVLDGAHDGARLAELSTGDGVDDLDYDAPKKLLYVAAAKARRLTLLGIDDKGQPAVVATAAMGEHARNAVADTDGNVYVADSASAQLLIFAAPPK